MFFAFQDLSALQIIFEGSWTREANNKDRSQPEFRQARLLSTLHTSKSVRVPQTCCVRCWTEPPRDWRLKIKATFCKLDSNDLKISVLVSILTTRWECQNNVTGSSRCLFTSHICALPQTWKGEIKAVLRFRYQGRNYGREKKDGNS